MADINETLGQSVTTDIESKEDEISKNGGLNVSLEDFTSGVKEAKTITKKEDEAEQTQNQNPQDNLEDIVKNTETEITPQTAETLNKEVSDTDFLVSPDRDIAIIQDVQLDTRVQENPPVTEEEGIPQNTNGNAAEATGTNNAPVITPVAESSNTPIVGAINDENETVTIKEDSFSSGNLLNNLTDSDSTSHSITTFSILGDPTQYSSGEIATIENVGTITILGNGNYTFTPIANYNGTVPQITYTIVDNNHPEDTDTSTLTLTVDAVNDKTVVADDSATTNEDAAIDINVLANDTDTVDGTAA
ncbi:MAG: Ig-like domain-containing protein, partial [Arcobacteraceae bacterium]